MEEQPEGKTPPILSSFTNMLQNDSKEAPFRYVCHSYAPFASNFNQQPPANSTSIIMFVQWIWEEYTIEKR